MTTRAGIAAIALLLAAALAAPAAAAEQRPISGQFTAQAGPTTPRCGPDALTLGFEVRGTAAHLGSLTGIGSNCTEFTLATEAVDVWDGLATFTAADGSSVTTTSSGSQGAPVDGRATFEIVHIVTGGTGRLAGAAGVWTVTGVIDFTNGTIAGDLSGWLSY